MARRPGGPALWRAALLAPFAAFAALPLLWQVGLSLTPTRLLFSAGPRLWPAALTPSNYLAVFERTPFPSHLGNSLAVSGVAALSATALGAAAGYALARCAFPGRRLATALLLASQAIPSATLLAPLYRLWSAIGLVDTLPGLALVYAALNAPFAALFMAVYVDRLPREYEEAAWLDGATRLQAVRHVVLPLAAPGLATAFAFAFVACWGELPLALMLDPSAAATLPVGLLAFTSRASAEYGQMAAAGVLALVPPCTLLVALGPYLRRGFGHLGAGL